MQKWQRHPEASLCLPLPLPGTSSVGEEAKEGLLVFCGIHPHHIMQRTEDGVHTGNGSQGVLSSPSNPPIRPSKPSHPLPTQSPRTTTTAR